MPQWLIKLFHSLGRKSAAKRTGIAEIPTTISAEGHGAGLYTQLREAGFTDEALTKLIKSEKDIIRLVNKVESMQKQRTPKKKKTPIVKDPTKEIIDWDRDPFRGWTPKIVPKETEAQIKARMIKENRSNVQKSYLRQLDKKIMDEMDLTKADLENMSSTALDDLRRNADPVGMRKQFDEITEGRGVGDFPDDPLKEPDYASGGRIGFAGGTIIKELVKRIYDIKAGIGIYKGLSATNKAQLIKKFIDKLEAAPGGKKYLDNLWTKKIKKLEETDRLKKIEQKAAAQSLAIKNYPEGPSTLPWSKEQEMHWKRFTGEDIKEEVVDTDYIIDQADELLRKKASGGIARVGMFGGGAAVKVWKKFVEKLFKEEMTKPTFRNLDPRNKEWAKRQVENYNKKLPGITKKYEEFKKTGKLPEDMHVDDIFQKEHGISNNEYFRGYDTKKLRNKEVDYDYYREILDDAENDIVQGDETLEHLEALVKEQDDYHAYMYDQYKTGKLDPKAGEHSRGRLELLRERADSAYGDPKMFTRDEMDELDVLEDYFAQVDKEEAFRSAEAKEIARGKASGSPWYTDPKTLTPEDQLRKEFPGIDDNMIRNILTDKNPQRIAEVKQTMREALEMQQKGISSDEIIKTLKDTTRKKQATGGIAGQLHLNRTGYFRGALADTKEGKAMSPGTRADYSPGQGHRENVGRPPGGGDPRMTYTAPPRKSTPERDVWNLKRWEPKSGTWFGGPTQKYLRGADLNKWYSLKRKEFYESLEDDEPEIYSEFDRIPVDKYYGLEIGRNYVPTREDLLTIGPYEKHSGSASRSYPYESELAKGGLAKILGV